MRNSLITFLSLLFILVFSASCNDDEIEKPVTPDPPTPDGVALQNFFATNISEQKQHFTINATTGGWVQGDKGTVLQFTSGSFLTENDEEVTGEVNIEFIEIFDRSTMVLTIKPTMGKTADGLKTALKSGGQFFVQASQDGKILKPGISGYTIVAPVDNTGGADEAMQLFNGVEECENDTCQIIWEEQPGERGIGIDGFQNQGGYYDAYYAFQNKFGWTNIDRWYNDPREKTTVYVDVPEGFDNTNCVVFMAYKGDAALARFDVYNEDTELFTEHYGLVPIGLEVHFILVSIIEDEIHYAIQSATITKNHTEIISTVKSITKSDLIDLIEDLP